MVAWRASVWCPIPGLLTQGQHGELSSNLDLGSREKVELTGPSLLAGRVPRVNPWTPKPKEPSLGPGH